MGKRGAGFLACRRFGNVLLAGWNACPTLSKVDTGGVTILRARKEPGRVVLGLSAAPCAFDACRSYRIQHGEGEDRDDVIGYFEIPSRGLTDEVIHLDPR